MGVCRTRTKDKAINSLRVLVPNVVIAIFSQYKTSTLTSGSRIADLMEQVVESLSPSRLVISVRNEDF